MHCPTPFSIRDLSTCRFLVFTGVLEPIPCRYRGITVLFNSSIFSVPCNNQFLAENKPSFGRGAGGVVRWENRRIPLAALKSWGGKNHLTDSSTVVYLEWIPEVVRCPHKRGHPGPEDLILTATQDEAQEPASLPCCSFLKTSQFQLGQVRWFCLGSLRSFPHPRIGEAPLDSGGDLVSFWNSEGY